MFFFYNNIDKENNTNSLRHKNKFFVSCMICSLLKCIVFEVKVYKQKV